MNFACVTNSFADEVSHLKKTYNITCAPHGPACNKFFLIEPNERLSWKEYWITGEENPMTGFSTESHRVGVVLHCDGKPVMLANRGQYVWPREKKSYLGMDMIPDKYLF